MRIFTRNSSNLLSDAKVPDQNRLASFVKMPVNRSRTNYGMCKLCGLLPCQMRRTSNHYSPTSEFSKPEFAVKSVCVGVSTVNSEKHHASSRLCRSANALGKYTSAKSFASKLWDNPKVNELDRILIGMLVQHQYSKVFRLLAIQTPA